MLREFEDQENLMAELDEQVFFIFLFFFQIEFAKKNNFKIDHRGRTVLR
jgi:hypothetical protein